MSVRTPDRLITSSNHPTDIISRLDAKWIGTETIGSERWAFRITQGRLSRRGRWHPNQPCVFLILNGKRWP